jgi:hypothetical protein
MTYARSIIEKYRKVCVLAKEGTDGEQNTAIHIKNKMEGKYPGIAQQLRWQERQAKEKDEGWGFDDRDAFYDEVRPKSTFQWSNLAGVATDFFSKVKDFTDAAIGLQGAKNLVQTAKFTTRENKTGSVSITFRMEKDLINKVAYLTEEQKFAFLEEAAQAFADNLGEIIYEDESSEEN